MRASSRPKATPVLLLVLLLLFLLRAQRTK